MPKISPIYNLITELKQEDNNLADHFLHRASSSRNYFLFKLPTSTSAILEENYILEEEHFSIDEEYNYSQHGYTPIHYTQSYSSKTENKYIVIHGFLNAKGEYLYSQAKELDDKKIFTGTYVDLTSDEEAILKTHIEKHTPVLEPIFTEKKAREKQLKKESENLDWELTTLSQSLDFEETRKEYIEKARQFIDTVQHLNRYNETQDKRNLFLFNIIEQIEKIDACTQQKPISKKSEKEPVQEVFEIKGEIQQSESIEDLYTQAITKFSEIIAEFQKRTPDSLEKKHELANALHEQLFIIYYFPEALLSKQNKQKIKKALNHIYNFYQTQVQYLIQEALKGNLETVKQLFPVCSRYITSNFYETLVNSLLEKKWNTIQENVLSICDYLNENDNRYRNYIFHLSQENEYPISKQVFELFIKNINNLNKYKNCKDYKSSLLFQLYFKNKKILFEAFLRHGAYPNTWGLKTSETKMTLTVFFLIIDFQKSNYLEYLDFLKILLLYDADPNTIFTKEAITNQNNQHLQHTKTRLEMKSKGKTILPFEKVPTQLLQSAIEQLNCITDFDLWTTLVKKSSLNNLAIGLTCFYENKLLRNGCISSNKYSICYTDNEDETYLYFKEKAQLQSKIGLFPCYIFSPEIIQIKDNKEFKNIYKNMKLIEEHLVQKLSILNITDFEKAYNELFEKAKNSFIRVKIDSLKQESLLIFNYFLGCECLLMLYAQLSIPLENQRRFIKTYSTELYNNIIQIIERIYSKPLAEKKSETYKKIQLSFSQKHKIFSEEKIILDIKHCTTELNPEVFSPRFTKVDLSSPEGFYINHYGSNIVYNESEFNKKDLKPKPKR